MKTVVNFIKNKTVLHDSNVYIDDILGSFAVKPYRFKSTGIYFICINGEIQKVGKADGKGGFNQRFYQYRSPGSRVSEQYISMFSRLYKKYGKNFKLEFYVYLMGTERTIHEDTGFEIEYSAVRSLENLLSLQAEKEGHPLLLSSIH